VRTSLAGRVYHLDGQLQIGDSVEVRMLEGLRGFMTRGRVVGPAAGGIAHHAAVGLAAALLLGGPAAAQEKLCPCSPPSPPPPSWTGTLGAGLALTGGNSDTTNYNLDFALKHDPGRKGIFKADGLYLRADTGGEATVNRTSLGSRYEYALGGGGRLFAFGELRILRDVLKDVDHLITPGVGVGYRVVTRDDIQFAVDGGVGLALEKLTGLDGTTDGAVNAGETFVWKLSKSASFVHTARALWKMDDFGDSYYHFDAGILASITTRFDLKLSFADDYKSIPPGGKKKNDTAVLATIVFKI
jgi:putative salt-induced outer membrane protein YdiY